MNNKNLTPFKLYALKNFPFIEADFDAITNYELLCKIVEYLNNVIASQNETMENVQNLSNAFNQLYNYVNDYFDNLDVQEEINNKLDEMVEDGTLEEIITNYLRIKGELCFDTLADMVAGTNLIDGSFVYIYGHYSIGDGGQAHYKVREITNDDIVDGYSIVALDVSDSLIAELNEKEIVPEIFGAYGDGTHDDTQAIQRAVNYKNILKLNSKTYLVTDTIDLPNNIQLFGNGINSTIKVGITDGSPVFKNTDSVMHFNISNFYMVGTSDTNAIGFEFTNPYDSCTFNNLYIDNIKNIAIKCGTDSTISQSLYITNCMIYGQSTGTANTNLIHLTKCYETNLIGNKLLFRQGNLGTVPCLYLFNTYDLYASGNSFADSSDCAIQFDGEARYNRIIGNTYENITGEKLIYFNGTTTDDGQYNIIIETNYYNASAVVLMNNCVGNTIIGLKQSGGRRSFAINNKNYSTIANGNAFIYNDGPETIFSRTGFLNYLEEKRFAIFCEDSQYADNGLVIMDRKNDNKRTFIKKNYIEFEKAGYKIKMTSPDGNTSKYISINNSGELVVTDN